MLTCTMNLVMTPTIYLELKKIYSSGCVLLILQYNMDVILKSLMLPNRVVKETLEMLTL